MITARGSSQPRRAHSRRHQVTQKPAELILSGHHAPEHAEPAPWAQLEAADIDSAGVQHGFTDWNGKFTTINDPNAGTASGQGTSVGYINDLGQVTGSYTESNGDSVAFAGPIGKFTTVSDPVAPAFSTLTAAINDAGVIVGEWLDANATFHRFSAVHGVFTPIEDPAGTEGTHVDGISNRGVIVGFYVDSSGNFHGFELSPAR